MKVGVQSFIHTYKHAYIHTYIDCTSWMGPFSSNIKKGNAYLEEFGTELIKNYYFKNHGQNVRKKVP